jgi:hypothetical protein
MSKLVNTTSLKFLDVIASDRFVFGCKQFSIYDPQPIKVGFDSPRPHDESTDPTRSLARYVVLSVRTEGNTRAHGGPYDTWRQVTAQRLNEDDTYNPEGEVICFPIGSRGREDEIREVTLVGRMQLVMMRVE